MMSSGWMCHLLMIGQGKTVVSMSEELMKREAKLIFYGFSPSINMERFQVTPPPKFDFTKPEEWS